MTAPSKSAPSPRKGVSKAALAKTKHEHVVQQAGAPGHIVTSVPEHRLRLDLVDPVLQFVTYGLPATQGSHKIKYIKGKPVPVDANDGLEPWREAVRSMSKRAIMDWRKRTGKGWVALNEGVVIAITVTLKDAPEAARKRGDLFATGTPDLDKLQRAIGDALAPTPVPNSVGAGLGDAQKRKVRDEVMRQRRAVAVLHDDARIVAWERCRKVYANTTADSLGYSGVTIRVWRLADLEKVNEKPLLVQDGMTWMTAADLRSWSRPLTGESWDEASDRLWLEPEAVFAANPRVVSLRGRGISDQGCRTVLRHLALRGPDDLVGVTEEPLER